jgi:hypothetical protein
MDSGISKLSAGGLEGLLSFLGVAGLENGATVLDRVAQNLLHGAFLSEGVKLNSVISSPPDTHTLSACSWIVFGDSFDIAKYSRTDGNVTSCSPAGRSFFDIRNAVASPGVERFNTLYRIELSVTSLDAQPITGPVVFFLHPTFANPKQEVPVASAPEVRLTVLAYGAFTVGVECDNGQTRLELDLSEDPALPPEFRAR